MSRAVADDWIGLTLAADFDLREMGMLYYVAASSHRLGDALQRLERYARLGNEALVVRIRTGSVCRVGLSYAGVPRHWIVTRWNFWRSHFCDCAASLLARK